MADESWFAAIGNAEGVRKFAQSDALGKEWIDR
jgi:hypothetical protein